MWIPGAGLYLAHRSRGNRRSRAPRDRPPAQRPRRDGDSSLDRRADQGTDAGCRRNGLVAHPLQQLLAVEAEPALDPQLLEPLKFLAESPPRRKAEPEQVVAADRELRHR